MGKEKPQERGDEILMSAGEEISRLAQEGRSRPKPRIVYKFLDSIGGRLALLEKTIKYSSILQLNDPFECIPKGISQRDAKRIIDEAECAKQDIRQWNKFCDSYPALIPPPGDLRKQLRNDPNKQLQHAFSHLSEHVRKMLVLHSSKSLAIASFTNRKDSIPMWSHYAEQHKGIAIGYNTACFKWRFPEGVSLLPVTYSRERIEIPLILEEAEGILDVLSTTKSLGWRYESEWRSVLVVTDKKMGEMKSMFIEFPKEFIAEIIIGFAASIELRRTCYRFCAENPKTCRLFQAELDKERYALRFKRKPVVYREEPSSSDEYISSE